MLRFFGVLLVLTGCAGAPVDASRFAAQPLQQGPSQVLFLFALGPKNAFTTGGERDQLWAALRGDVASIRPYLGDLEKVPFDYRVQYQFNHATPNDKRAEFGTIGAWSARLTEVDQRRVRESQTLLLVKGSLQPFAQDGALRLSLATALFLCIRYDGVAFDLLTRRAYGQNELKSLLTPKTRATDHLTLAKTRVEDQVGLRTLGLPKFGYPDLFIPNRPKTGGRSQVLSSAETLIQTRRIPGSFAARVCRNQRFDFGCLWLDPIDSHPTESK